MARISKRQAKKVAKAVKKHPKTALVLAILFIIICIVGYFVYKNLFPKKEAKGAISFHFLELGNQYAGDCVYVKAGDVDIIIDGGSKPDSVIAINSYVSQYVTDGTIEYAIITHAHEDHIAAFAGDSSYQSLFKYYEFETIIDFPKTESTSKTYQRYCEERQNEVDEGASHYTALQCYNNEDGAKREYELGESITLEILYNYYYDHKASDENDYSVCVQFTHGSNKYLFTGDLEEKGEKFLIEYNQLSKVALYKAGHHGSNSSSCTEFLSVIKPEICVATCVAGSVEYSQDLYVGTFPTQGFIDRISKWTEKIYVTSLVTGVKLDGDKYKNEGFTSMNGNVVIISGEQGVSVECSNNDTLLKDTDWFKEYRECENWN